ncbi:hypothetical protein CVO79_18800 [Escherichia coli]|nr:hypothetical protein CVO79_18800 [Escherichia coli]
MTIKDCLIPIYFLYEAYIKPVKSIDLNISLMIILHNFSIVNIWLYLVYLNSNYDGLHIYHIWYGSRLLSALGLASVTEFLQDTGLWTQ